VTVVDDNGRVVLTFFRIQNLVCSRLLTPSSIASPRLASLVSFAS
jgi:hypothetical protein